MNICYILKNKSDRFNAHFFKCEIVALVLSISTSSIACYFGDLSQGYFCTPINHISILGNCYLSQSSPIQIIASIVGCLILIALFIVVVAVIHISNQMIEPDIVQKKSLIRLYVLYSLVFTATRSQVCNCIATSIANLLLYMAVIWDLPRPWSKHHLFDNCVDGRLVVVHHTCQWAHRE